MNITLWYLHDHGIQGADKTCFLIYFLCVLLISFITYFCIEKRINKYFGRKMALFLDSFLKK